jgi:REP element-mobilizing transposase RayT
VSIYLHKSHNVSVLLYHLVCVAKYRRVIFDQAVDQYFKQVCLNLEKRYELHFLEIGTDKDHVHFLIQSVPTYSPTKIVRTIKSITAREMFAWRPELHRQLWGAEFWTDGYFINTVGKNGTETVILRYIRAQGQDRNYVLLHKDQLRLF